MPWPFYSKREGHKEDAAGASAPDDSLGAEKEQAQGTAMRSLPARGRPPTRPFPPGHALNEHASAKTPLSVRCPLCGKEFRAGEALQCSTCALAPRCGLVMCPNCSYEFPL